MGKLFWLAVLLFISFPGNIFAVNMSHSSTFGTNGTGDGQFRYPSRIAIDTSGNIYVTDTTRDDVQKFNSSGTFITKWGSTGSGNTQFNDPQGIAVDSSGNVYVADNGNSKIKKFDSSGNYLATYSTNIYYPYEIAIDASGNFYVGDYDSVEKFNSSWVHQASWNGTAQGGSAFSSVGGIGFDTSGNIYVFSRGSGTGSIQKFSSAGVFERSWTGNGAGGVSINSAGSMAVSPSNFIYTTQSTNTRIQKFTSSGTFVEYWGSYSSGTGGFVGPEGIAFYGSKIYVVENGYGTTARVHVLSDTDLTDTTAPTVSTFSPADNATGVALDANLVINFSENISKKTGNITIKRSSDNSTFETIDITGNQVATSSAQVTINPSNNFAESTGYYVQIDATAFDDAFGNSYAGISDTTTWSFTSADLTTPTISAVTATPSANSAVITWDTTEASSSQVEYGLTSSYGSTSTEADTSPRVTSHSLTLSNLHSCVRYYYRVKSTDASSNQAISSSSSFSTTGCAASSISTGSESSIASTGGTLNLSNGSNTAGLTAPTGFSTAPATFQINKLDSATSPTAPSGTSLVANNFYDLSAVSSTGSAMNSFSQPVSFVVNYDSTVEATYLESSLDVYKYSGGAWTDQNCTLDMGANTLTCSLSSFSVYGVFGQTGSASTISSNTESTSIAQPSCGDQKPDGIPDLFQIDTGQNWAKLFFTPVLGYKKFYISYSTAPIAQEHGVEVELGSDGVQSFTVNFLSPQTVYYFKVRSQNGCRPGEWSQIKSAKTTSPPTNIVLPDKEPIVEGVKEDLITDRCSYVVKDGDTLWDISKSKFGDATDYQIIIKENESFYPSIDKKILPGWELKLPCPQVPENIALAPLPSPVVAVTPIPTPVPISEKIGSFLVDLGNYFIGEPTKIYSVVVENIDPKTVKISWKTNHPADGKVNYGLTPNYSWEAQSSETTTDHEFVIGNLQPKTKYHFEVMSKGKTYVYDANREFITD